MDVTSDITMWTAVVAFFMPVIIAFIQQPRWSKATRSIVAAVASGVAGLGTVYFTDPDAFLKDGSLTMTVVLTVIIASTAAYKHFWENVGLRTLESATSPGDDTLEEERVMRHLVEGVLEQVVMEDEDDEAAPTEPRAMTPEEQASVEQWHEVTSQEAGEQETPESRPNDHAGGPAAS